MYEMRPVVDEIPPEVNDMRLKVAEIQPALDDIWPTMDGIRPEVAKSYRKWMKLDRK